MWTLRVFQILVQEDMEMSYLNMISRNCIWAGEPSLVVMNYYQLAMSLGCLEHWDSRRQRSQLHFYMRGLGICIIKVVCKWQMKRRLRGGKRCAK